MQPKQSVRILFLTAVLLTSLVLGACTFVVQVEPTPVPGATPPAAEEPAVVIDEALLGTWQWVEAVLEGEVVTVGDPSRYTVTFQADGRVAAQFDCNRGGGSYTADGTNLSFGPIMTTLMGCPSDTQDYQFGAGLGRVVGYTLDGDTLTLRLDTEGDSMTLVRAE